jgi:hypothetical protein
MLGITHLVFAILLISFFRLDRTQAFAVLMFGVLIDLDHTFRLEGGKIVTLDIG